MPKPTGLLGRLARRLPLVDRALGSFGYIKSEEQVVRVLSSPWDRSYGIEAPSTTDDYLDQYGESGWVYVAANKIAKKCSSFPVSLFVEGLDGEKEDLHKHVFLDVLRRPNDMMSEIELRFLTHLQLELAGEAFWYVAPNQVGGPAAIYPLMPDKVTVVPGVERLIQGYIYEVDGQSVSFEAEEVIHFRYPNPDPDTFFRGASPIKAATYAIATGQNAEIWNYRFFKQGAIPKGVLETDARLDDPEVERLLRLWNRHHRGEDQWHKAAVAQQGLKYKDIGLKHIEMDFVGLLDWSRNTILSIMGVPRSIAGIIEDANRANAFQDELNFATYTIKPILDLVASELNAYLSGLDARLRCEFRGVIPRDAEFQLKRHETYLKNFVYTVNDVREELGKEPVPWGDRPIAPMSMMPLGDWDGDTGAADARMVRLLRLALAGQPETLNLPPTRAEPDPAKVRAAQRAAELWGTKDAREDDWRAYVERLQRREAKLRSPLRKWFQGLQDHVNRRLRSLYGEDGRALGAGRTKDTPTVDEILFNVTEEAGKLAAIILPALAGSIEDEAGYLISQLGLDLTFDAADPQVMAWSRLRAERFSFEVTSNTAQTLRGTLDEGIRNGETLTQLTDRVSEVFRNKKGWEAERIARTETACASSYGRQAVYMQSEVIDQKRWLTALDERVRDSHMIDGQTVAKAGDFTLGSGVATQGPGLSGVADEDIQCRCVTVPVISR